MKNEVNNFLKLVHAIGFIFVFFTVGGSTIYGIRQGDYTLPIFLIFVLLIIWMLQEPVKKLKNEKTNLGSNIE